MMLWLLLGLLAMTASMLGVATAVSTARLVLFLAEARSGLGHVVAHEPDSEGSGVRAIVAFDVNGQTHRASGNSCVDPNRIPLGTPLPVRYLPRDPARAEIGTTANLLTPPLALGLVFVVMAAATFGLAILRFS